MQFYMCFILVCCVISVFSVFFLKFALFNIAIAYHIYYRTKQSEQVCFILPKSIKLLETCYALRVRCTLL